MVDLRADVIAQIEELSTLVGDLVDLTREDAGGVGARGGRHERGHRPQPGAGSAAPQRYPVRRRRRRLAGLRRRRRAVARGAQPAGQRGQVEPVRRPCRGPVAPARRRRTPSWWCPTTGPGIPPQERRLVFERFYRSTSARAMPGSGLGLAIVKQVVAQTRWDAARRGHRAGRAATGNVDLRAAARPADRRDDAIRMTSAESEITAKRAKNNGDRRPPSKNHRLYRMLSQSILSRAAR